MFLNRARTSGRHPEISGICRRPIVRAAVVLVFLGGAVGSALGQRRPIIQWNEMGHTEPSHAESVRAEAIRAEPIVHREGVREPASVIAKPYAPASRREEAADEAVAAETGAYLENVAPGGGREKTSALATSFGRGGGLQREAWWNGAIQQSILDRPGDSVSLGLGDLYRRTLEHSNRVKALATTPLVRETGIAEAEGEFNPELYAESRYDRRNDPTGSLLETERPGSFLRERAWSFAGGLRKRVRSGAQVGLQQEFAENSSNAPFFVPREQGQTRVTLSVMQPLLRGAGVAYNRSQVQLAKLDAESGYHQFVGELEALLAEINRLYWRIYLARGVLLEKKRIVDETEAVVAEIESRGDLDSIASQRSRARAALARRKAELVRAELEVKNAESRLRTLVNDPALVGAGVAEIVPGDLPIATMEAADFDRCVAEALSQRPEIRMAENDFRSADLRELVAANERRPRLDLVGEVGTAGLRASGNDLTQAFNDRYNGGQPTWGVGVVGSIPLGNETAKARHLRAQLEARQARDLLRATMDEVLLDVQIAHREVATAWPDARAKWEAATAAEQELAVLRDRREVETAESGASLYLEQLLDAQQRRAFAREDFLAALAIYNAALANLDRAKGTLLQAEGIGVRRTEDDAYLPLIQMVKDEASAQAKSIYQSYK
jgi:outer membrane protein TolC